MNDFEYTATFYTLVLGLALANTATGAAEIWRSRDRVAWGICIPLLGLAVISYSLGQWWVSWVAQTYIRMSQLQLLSVMFTTLPIVFISLGMYPKDTLRWSSLDEYYLAHRKVLLSFLMISPAAAITFNVVIYRDFSFDPLARALMTIVAPAVAMPFRNKWAHAAALTTVSAYYICFRLIGA